MRLDEMVANYIGKAERVFTEIEIAEDSANVRKEKVNTVVDSAKRYLEDAKYYRDRNKFEVGLASVAYCEGLLDALRILEVARFSWPTDEKKLKRRR